MDGSESGHTDTEPTRSVGAVIRRFAQQDPQAPAIVATGFDPCSFGDLVTQIDRARTALEETGLDQGARVAFSLPSQPEAALAALAVGCWATAVPVDHAAPLAEVEHQLAFVRADAVVVPRGIDTPARSVAAARGIPTIEARTGEGVLRLDLSGPAQPRTRAPTEPGPESILYILQTSGTTSNPKHVLWSHGNQLAVTRRLGRSLGLTPSDRALVILPVHHSFGINTVWSAILTGGSLAFPGNPLHFDVSEWFGELKPTYYRAVPAQHLFILENLRKLPASQIPRHLRLVVTGSAAISQDARQALQDLLGVPVVETYGSTEAGFVSGDLAGVGPVKAGTVGVPEAGIVAIVGEDGQPAPAGEAGEILIGGPTVTPGYLDAPELNRSAFMGGWYRTGDIGFIDDEGFLTIRGRVKEIIARGAEKVTPLEVEEVLKQHSAIVDAVVFGVPHERLGEDVAAAVVRKPDATLAAADVRRFAGTRLAWFKIPRRILFLDEMPKGPGGKELRRVLQGMAAENRRVD